jgi:hypothetical protein
VEYGQLWKFWELEKKVEIDPQSIGVEQLKKLIYCINLLTVRWEENMILIRVSSQKYDKD